ncbi:MAG: cyclic pyranopterin monophosphate synthase MoaC [Gemmatimonadota bacterium]|nr:cyclic pyranopterin monophosphate synthase MoaC [Gemmatimonadota bacterium]
MANLTHIADDGTVRMVDVTEKALTDREAVAGGEIVMAPATARLVSEGELPKGNVLETARIAGIMAAKRTWELIPLCHPVDPTGIELRFDVGRDRIEAEAGVRVTGRTGVEMEALTAVSAALLTVYDMCKAVDKNMEIRNIRLLRKTGGRSGDYVST